MLATRLGRVEVSRLWTAKATTSSTQRRLATRLGEASCSDRVSVVKATSPDTDNPGEVKLYYYSSPLSIAQSL